MFIFVLKIATSFFSLFSFLQYGQARKMRCAPQEIGNNNPEVLEARKDSIPTIYQQQNKLTSLEVTINTSPFFIMTF